MADTPARDISPIQLIATSTFGIEAVVRGELEGLGFKDFKTTDGRVEFSAQLSDIPRVNIGLRCADRVFLKLAEFKATDFDQLFDPVAALPWERWIPKDGKMTVVGKSAKSKLISVRTCQSMIKKAMIKRLKAFHKIDWFSESGPEFIVNFTIFKDVVQLSLDSTGSGLHKRGYRTHAGEVPLKETLAAALVLLSGWNKDTILVDPMCGSGTILVEAAMMARHIAPGLNRAFAAEDWKFVEAKSWAGARQAAKKAIVPAGEAKLFGFDIHPERIKDSQGNARRAGVAEDIILEKKDIADWQVSGGGGTVITNPPYGIKLGPGDDLPRIYAALDRALGERPDWALYLVTADKTFPQSFRRSRPDKIRKLYNGTIEVSYFQYYGK